MNALLPSKPVFSMAEVMQILGVSRTTIEQELRSGRLAFKRVGKRRIAITYPALLAYLQSFDTYQGGAAQDELPW